MNVDQVYEQAIRPLSSKEKLSIARRIITEIETMETEDEDFAAGIPAPPFAVRDAAHLEELLLEGLKGPFQEFTDQSMNEIRQEVHRRHAARQNL